MSLQLLLECCKRLPIRLHQVANALHSQPGDNVVATFGNSVTTVGNSVETIGDHSQPGGNVVATLATQSPQLATQWRPLPTRKNDIAQRACAECNIIFQSAIETDITLNQIAIFIYYMPTAHSN